MKMKKRGLNLSSIKRICLIACLYLLSTVAFGSVWKSEHKWNSGWEEKYSEWISSDKVRKDMFIDKNSPYYGVKADCADAAYALRIIFSYENRLPFAIKSVRGKKRSGYRLIGNRSNVVNHIADPDKRVVAFINRLAPTRTSSYTLKSNDTYPVALDHITPGTIYHFVKANKSGKIRHVVMIKKINPNGTFDTIYSTQSIRRNNAKFFAAAKKGGKVAKIRRMIFRKNQTFHFLPDKHSGGFRKFIWPRLLGTNADKYPKELNYSREQYQLAARLKHGRFFKLVKDKLATATESIEVVLQKKLDNLCELSRDRVEAVDEALAFLRSKSKKRKRGSNCMNYQEFDAYSTPMRDQELRIEFETLRDEWKKIKGKRERSIAGISAKSKQYQILREIFETRRKNKSGFCPVKISKKKSLNLGIIYDRLRRKHLSSDPHQSLATRWGESFRKKRGCKVFYN